MRALIKSTGMTCSATINNIANIMTAREPMLLAKRAILARAPAHMPCHASALTFAVMKAARPTAQKLNVV